MARDRDERRGRRDYRRPRRSSWDKFKDSARRKKDRALSFLWPRSNGRKVGNWLKLILFLAVAYYILVYVFSIFSASLFVQEGTTSIVGSVEDGVAKIGNATGTAISNGVKQLKITVSTPFYRMSCQRKYLQKNPKNLDEKIRKCVRKKQGLPVEEEEGEDVKKEWSVSAAQNYLSVRVQNTLRDDAPHLRDVCGSRCGVVKTTLRNPGSKDIRLEDLYLTVDGVMFDGNYPITVNSQNALRTGKFNKLDQFIEGTGRLNEWTDLEQIENMNQQKLELQPGETKTVTFLVNMTPRTDYSVQEVRDKLESYRDRADSFTDQEGKTLNDYCNNKDSGIYQGGNPVIVDGNVEFRSGSGLQEFSGEVCKSQVRNAVKGTSKNIYGSEKISSEVHVNYSSTTSSVLNIRYNNINYWDELSTQERQSMRMEYCSQVGEGTILKQTSNLAPSDIVAFLMYTNCEIHYYPEETENRILVEIHAKSDSRRINRFRIESLEGLSYCDRYYPSEGTSAMTDTWFKKSEKDWVPVQEGGPTNAITCEIGLPTIPESQGSDTLNLGLEAGYTASTSEKTQFKTY